MGEPAEVPPAYIAGVRPVCLGLPEVLEEPAWVGLRWRVRTRTFAHLLMVVDGRPPAYAQASGTSGPVPLLMFRSAGPELVALRNAGLPFFAPVWRNDEVGLVLGPSTDWDEVAELVTDSYCAMAPKGLRGLVRTPDA